MQLPVIFLHYVSRKVALARNCSFFFFFLSWRINHLHLPCAIVLFSFATPMSLEELRGSL